MKRIKKIPDFKNIKEEAEFWDTHDVTDYLPQMKKVKLSFDPERAKEELVSFRVQSMLKKRLEKTARNYGLNLSALLRVWFIEKLRESEQGSDHKMRLANL